MMWRTVEEITPGKEWKKLLVNVSEVSKVAEKKKKRNSDIPDNILHIMQQFLHIWQRAKDYFLNLKRRKLENSHNRNLVKNHSFALRIKSNLGVSLECHHDSVSHEWENSGGSLKKKKQSIRKSARKSGMKEGNEKKLRKRL